MSKSDRDRSQKQRIGRETRIAFLAVGGLLLIAGVIVGALTTGGLAGSATADSAESDFPAFATGEDSDSVSDHELAEYLEDLAKMQATQTKAKIESQVVDLAPEDINLSTAESVRNGNQSVKKYELQITESLPSGYHNITVTYGGEDGVTQFHKRTMPTSVKSMNLRSPSFHLTAAGSMRLANSSQMTVEVTRFVHGEEITFAIVTLDTDQLFRQSGAERSDVIQKEPVGN